MGQTVAQNCAAGADATSDMHIIALREWGMGMGWQPKSDNKQEEKRRKIKAGMMLHPTHLKVSAFDKKRKKKGLASLIS